MYFINGMFQLYMVTKEKEGERVIKLNSKCLCCPENQGNILAFLVNFYLWVYIT